MKDRVVQFPHRHQLIPVAGQEGVYDIIAKPGTITEAGTPINKASLLKDATAALCGLTGDDATVDRALFAAGRWRLVQSYTVAGTYTWTAPDLNNGQPYKIGVHIIGGGGSGAAGKAVRNDTNYWFNLSGGASGYALSFIREVIPGQEYPVVVGAGALPATTTTANGTVAGTVGGTSTFLGFTAQGGNGGNGKGNTSSGSARADGADGGQGSDPQPSNRVSPALGSETPQISDLSGSVRGLSRYGGILNPFDGIMRLSAGSGCFGDAGSSRADVQDVISMPDGLAASIGVGVTTLDVNATAQKPTSPGSGGGAAMIAVKGTNVGTGIATSAAGADGAVFIYV